MNKKGELAWEYIAMIIIGLLVIVMIVIFSTAMREKILEGITHFTTNVLGR